MAEQKADRPTADSQPESSSPNRELGTRHNAPHTADCRRTRVQVVSLPPTSMGQRQADTHPWRRRTCPHISLARLSDMLTCLHSPGTLPPLFTGTRRHDSRPRKPLDAMRRLAGCSLMLAVMCSTRAHAPPSMQTPCPGHTPPTSHGAWLMRHGMHMSTATPGNATHAGYTTARRIAHACITSTECSHGTSWHSIPLGMLPRVRHEGSTGMGSPPSTACSPQYWACSPLPP